MKNTIIINGKEFRQYDETYYVSANGDVYSTYSQKLLKHNIDHDGYHRVDIHKKHMKVHRLVWLTWVGPTNDLLILHNDDDKNNNTLSNLRLGSQKDNIADCFMNDHRVGNVDHITVYDKKTKQTLTFSPMKEFITYCGHPSKSGSVKKFFNKNWFKKRYTIIDYGKGKV